MADFHESTDVVVVGSGLAGLAAAIEAAGAGAAVTVFEKMKLTGGNTRISDGGLAAPGNYLQRETGVADSPELFERDMLRAGRGLNDPALVRIVARDAAAVIDWTREELGVRYLERLDRFGGHSAARSLTTRNHTGADIIKAQVRKLRRLGVAVRTQCRLEGFVRNGDGSVRGVAIRRGYRFPDGGGGEIRTVEARRAVVLATGGFANDLKFRSRLRPVLDGSVASTNHRGATAEGLIAALRIGAFPLHLSRIQLGPWGCSDEKGYGKGGRFASYSVYPAGILVAPATASRVVNEWADRRVRAEALLETGRPGIGVVDAEGARLDPESLEQCLKSGKVRAFETLEALASAHGMPPGVLPRTVSAYNDAVAAGKTDRFGKDLGNARPLAAAPFYAIRLYPKVHYTPGGVAIDPRARVLDLNGVPLPGLYAAGEVTGGVHGASRLGSCALTECLVFGRIAGRGAAARE